MHGVQRGIGVLEDDLHLLTQGTAALAIQVQQILDLALVVIEHLAFLGLQQANDTLTQSALTATGLTNDAEGLAISDIKGNIVNCLNTGLLLLE